MAVAVRRGADVTGVVAALSLSLILLLAGCGDELATGPTTADLQAERAALSARLKKGRHRVAPSTKAVAESAAKDSASGLAEVDFQFVYEPAGRRDPFRSVRWDRERELEQTAQLGPLERLELEQLSVVAVVWDTNRPRALLADPSGHSYIVREGSRVGKNEGRVIHIGDDLVLVKETYVDFGGDQTTKDVELRIRRSEGG